jgi:hypothetical protein
MLPTPPTKTATPPVAACLSWRVHFIFASFATARRITSLRLLHAPSHPRLRASWQSLRHGASAVARHPTGATRLPAPLAVVPFSAACLALIFFYIFASSQHGDPLEAQKRPRGCSADSPIAGSEGQNVLLQWVRLEERFTPAQQKGGKGCGRVCNAKGKSLG